MLLAAAPTSITLGPADLRLLEPLRFNPRRTFSGRVRGERLSRKKGTSIEFADYREYAAGDDLRHLDWTILARLDRATIRTYQDEDDLAVAIALDTSLSMDFGEPSKFTHAGRLAAAMGFIGLIAQDAVYPIILGGREQPPGRALRGRASYRALSDWIGAQKPDGDRGLAASLARIANSGIVRPGVFVCVSDGLDPGLPDALKAVAARGHEIVFVQVLSEIEMDPDLEGDLRLLDAESGTAVEVTAHAQTLSAYKKNLADHCTLIEETVTRAGGRFLRSPAGQPLADFVAQGLRRAGVVS